jgi:hypothetical protein
MRYPKGFWTEVFKEVQGLLTKNPKMDANTVYILARRKVEEKYTSLSLPMEEKNVSV